MNFSRALYRRIAIPNLIASFASAIPLVAMAQTLGGGSTQGACQILRNLTRVVEVFGTVVLVVAVAILLWAGFLFMTAGGSEDKVTTARKYLIYSLVGLAVAVIATQADNIVLALVGGRFLNECRIDF